MGRKTFARKGGSLVHLDEVTMDRVMARGVSKLAPLATPWVTGAGMVPAAAITHHLWSAPGTIPWVAMGMTLAGTALTGLTWVVSHHRRLIGRLHSTATTGAAAAWMTAATVTGPLASPTFDIGLIVGATGALAWNIRGVIRSDNGDGAHDGPVDRLKELFAGAADKVGLEGTVLKNVEVKPRKVEATAQMTGGGTAEDLQKKLAALESAMGLPPGSLIVAANLDDASAPQIRISDPRLMRQPIPWTGPSRPGVSIAEPIRTGIWQDGEDVQWTILNHHTQVMGKTGVAKSFGGFWNFGGEVMTRVDAALFVADLDKGEQTVGDMRRGLHRVELDLPGAKRMLAEFYKVVRPRTDYLASKGLKEWQPGCGLTYLVLWLEEFPTLGDKLDMEREFIPFLRTCRSAGIHVVLSLQRSDWTQMPTFVRGQLANWCFGVANSADAAFGLSEAQQEAGARPELFADLPGMSYLGGPSIPADRIAMPQRAPMWTSEQMKAHAAAYPATDRPLDPVTAKYLSTGPGGWANPTTTTTTTAAAAPATQATAQTAAQESDMADDDSEVTGVAAEYARTEDPDPTMQADIDTELADAAGEWSFDTTTKMSPEQAQAVLRAAIERLRADNVTEFAPRDLKHVLERTKMGRSWIQKRLELMVKSGELEHDKDAGVYRFRALTPA